MCNLDTTLCKTLAKQNIFITVSFKTGIEWMSLHDVATGI